MLKGKYYWEIDTNIIPKLLLCQNKIYTITKIHPSYHIKKYYVIVNNLYDNIVLDVILSNCFHPNAYGGEKLGSVSIDKPPKFSKFCLPDTIINRWKFSEDCKYEKIPNDLMFTIKDFDNSFLKLWAMDNPHHMPYKSLVSASLREVDSNNNWITIPFPHFI